MTHSLVFSLTSDGKMNAVMYNSRGVAVAQLSEPVNSVEDAEPIARQFEEDHPDLFDDHDLVDVAAETEKKNPELFEDGGLIPVPEN